METESDLLSNRPSVDFAILADRAEAINNKVYIHGGGWDFLGLPEVPAKYPISLAVGILIPWNATNQEHTAAFYIVDADSEETDFRTEVKFNVGRPPVLTTGLTQRVMLGIPSVYVTFTKFGTYVLTVALNGITSKRVLFNIVRSHVPVGALPM